MPLLPDPQLIGAYESALLAGMLNAEDISGEDVFPEFREASEALMHSAAEDWAVTLEHSFKDNPAIRADVQRTVNEWLKSGDYDRTALRGSLEEFFGPARALMVARTETARAFNTANAITLKSHGWQQVQWNAAFDACEDCSAKDEEVMSIEDYLKEPILHPNCRCYADPVDTTDMSTGDEQEAES